ncbi:hypothetical protein BT96DRAFT_1079046, partial [Gymnopus androsaceus JB14]
ILNGFNKGRGGLGYIFTFASGNSAAYRNWCNLDGKMNIIYSVTISDSLRYTTGCTMPSRTHLAGLQIHMYISPSNLYTPLRSHILLRVHGKGVSGMWDGHCHP